MNGFTRIMDYIERKTYSGSTEITICHTEVPQEKAKTALDLMRHLAIVAGEVNGEDTAGRQKLRLMTPEEVVDRAISIADIAWNKFREKDWILDVPVPKVAKTDRPKEEPSRS